MQKLSNDSRRRTDSAVAASLSHTGPLSPASPTLTNPDLILPDYDEGAISLGSPQSPLMMWKNSHLSEMGFDLSPAAFTAGPITTPTPILYGNGTMLSDIGEVTEVESTCTPTRSRSGSIRSDFALMTSTALQYETIKQRIKQARMSHQRNTSVESNSTVTVNDRPTVLADFDDTLSIDDSNFQGDDEESVADSFMEDLAAQGALPADSTSYDLDDGGYSSPLSRRADLILANAKRRLSTMEGNLNRARSSLYSPVLASMTANSTPSPMGRPIPIATRGLDTSQRSSPSNHSRMFSESNLAENKPSIYTPRASSALATDGGFRRALQRSPNIEAKSSTNSSPSNHSLLYRSGSFSNSKVSLSGPDRSLEPLSEDETLEVKKASKQDAEKAGGDAYLSATGTFSSKDLKQRSVSATQMRDLKDQVNDLRGRLSSLCNQARADSAERRSLLSMRTPSPFTHAPIDQWYADSNKHGDATSTPGGSDAQKHIGDSPNVLTRSKNSAEGLELRRSLDGSPANRFIQPERATLLAASNPTNLRQPSPAPVLAAQINEEEVDVEPLNQGDDFDDQKSEDDYDFAEGDDYGEADDFGDTASESDVSLYHDTVQAQVSHEDREDAFDYEHFFLHSAMGSMSRKKMRQRSNSIDSYTSESSEDSVETTKGPVSTGVVPIIPNLARKGSVCSTSTMESFETATEGRRTQAGVITPEEYSDEYSDEYANQIRALPDRARTYTPQVANRTIYTPESSGSISGPKRSLSALHYRPQKSVDVSQKRLSASSALIGSNRSFPLVSQPKGLGVLTPEGSPDQELKHISESLLHETASICGKETIQDGETVPPMQMLQKDDQILVERLVASLGRCVLGLTESGRASAESRAYRRRIENARRILEGME